MSGDFGPAVAELGSLGGITRYGNTNHTGGEFLRIQLAACAVSGGPFPLACCGHLRDTACHPILPWLDTARLDSSLLVAACDWGFGSHHDLPSAAASYDMRALPPNHALQRTGGSRLGCFKVYSPCNAGRFVGHVFSHFASGR